jgi:hypothetical protein
MKITEENKNELFIEFCDMDANDELCLYKDSFKEAITKALTLYGVVSSACLCEENAKGKGISGWCSKHHTDWM